MTKTRSRVTLVVELTRLPIIILLCLCLLLNMTNAGGDLPDGWWKKCKARPIKDYKEYLSLVEGDFKDKFIFVDTYMEHCPYCYYCLDDFNKIIDDMTKWYGNGPIVFIKIDGTRIREFSRRYKINSFPKFLVIYPQTDGAEYSVFKANKRDYASFKQWMLNVLSDTPTLE